MDEIGAIMQEWNRLNDPDDGDTPEAVDALTFLGDGGEWLT